MFISMAELTWSGPFIEDARVSVWTIDDIHKEIREEIDEKFTHCRRMIGKAKWCGYFSSSRGKGETFGRWNKR